MFETMEHTGRRDVLRRIFALLFSVVVHAITIFVLAIFPLIFLGVLPEGELLTWVMAAPDPPAPLPPPMPPRKKVAASPPSNIIHKDFLQPTEIPPLIPPPGDEAEMGVLVREAFEGQAGIEGGIVGVGRAGIGDLLGATRPPVLPQPPPPKLPPKLVHVSGGVQAAKLIYKVQPIYPELAIRSRVSAVVLLEVKVDEEGNVSEVRVLKGHPLFDDAAVNAVRQWKYSPTLLNGEPVPVMASVTVIFNLR